MKKLIFSFLIMFLGVGSFNLNVSAGPLDGIMDSVSGVNEGIQKARSVIEYIRAAGSEISDLSAGAQAAYGRLNSCLADPSAACLLTATNDISSLSSEIEGLAAILSGELGQVFITSCDSGTVFCSIGGDSIEDGIATAKEELGAAFGDGIIQDTDIKTVVINFVNYLLGFLGLVAVIILIWAGIVYITSLGNDDRVGTAKNIIINTIIGILIILFAYVIVNFFINIGEDLTPTE